MIERAEIPAEQLTVDPVQSREQPWSGDDQDRRLAESVDSDGLLQDIIVRPLDASELSKRSNDEDSQERPVYTIIAGSRRYHAAIEAGHETLPCKVIDVDDIDAAWKSLSENTDRRELSEQEIASQLQLIYELVRPREDPESCPDCGTAVDDETGLSRHCDEQGCELPESPEEGPPSQGRFLTTEQALMYLTNRFLGRTDDGAVKIVEGHLRTAELPPILQSLFKAPGDRSEQEQTALDNYGIDTRTRLGSGDGKSGTSREIVKLHETVETKADSEAVDPTNAVLEATGSLTFEEMSEQKLRRTLREFRHEVEDELEDADSAAAQREIFRDALQRCRESLVETCEEVEPTRPFKKVDVLGPETQQHSRWHVRAMERRDVSGHGELVRELYQERLQMLADQEGWE